MPEDQVGGPGVSTHSGPWGFVDEGQGTRRVAIVHKSSLFLNLSPQDCKAIISAARDQEFQRRQTIHFEGDPVRNVVLLTSGCAKSIQVGQNGSEVILRLTGPGEVVGTVGLCGHARHCAMSQALRPCTALVWEAAVFEGFSQRLPTLRRNTVQILGRQLEDMQQRFREISTEKVAARLSRQLLRLLDQVGKQVNDAIEISLSREELAQLIGTTLFTVSRLLSDWDTRGIVVARREAVVVRNTQALVTMSESDE